MSRVREVIFKTFSTNQPTSERTNERENVVGSAINAHCLYHFATADAATATAVGSSSFHRTAKLFANESVAKLTVYQPVFVFFKHI